MDDATGDKWSPRYSARRISLQRRVSCSPPTRFFSFFFSLFFFLSSLPSCRGYQSENDDRWDIQVRVFFPQRIPFPSWWMFICFIKYLEIWLILSTLEIGSRVLALESFKGKLQRRETCHALRTVGNILKIKMAKWCTRGAADSTRRSVPQAEKKERKNWGWRKKSGRSHRLRQSRVYRLQCRWVA